MLRLLSRIAGGRRRRLWVGVATAATLLAAAAPAQAGQFVYVTNQSSLSNSVSQYDVGAGGLLAPLSPPTVAAGDGPIEVAVNPDGQSVYVANLGAGLSQYDVGAGGQLSPKSPATVGGPGATVAVSPDGQSVYVAGAGVAQYDVGAGGALSPKDPATVADSGSAGGIAVSPDGESVYVAHSSAGISQYDVGPGGALTPKNPPSVDENLSGLSAVAVNPDGQSVYAADLGGRVAQYHVGAGGLLVPLSPPRVAAGDIPLGVAVSPDGQSVYVTNEGSDDPSNGNDVSQYDVGPGGELSPKTPARVAAGFGPRGVAVSADGQSVYVANGFFIDNTPSKGFAVSQYDVGAGGALSPKSPATVAAGASPAGVAVNPVARVPTSKKQCKHGGWKQFGFKSQGRCIRSVNQGSS